MIFNGFKFGMLLQLAVGPMCLLVFNTSAAQGFAVGFSLVIAISLIDLLFITLSSLGVAAVLDKKNVKRLVKIFGALVLMLFGANMIAGVFNLSLLPGINLFAQTGGKGIFVQGLLLTASNPLTIIFWSGVFSTQVIEKHYNRRQLYLFGFGCVLSTLTFLTLVALLGTVISGFLTDAIIDILNACVGLIIIYFGAKLLLKRTGE